MGYAKWKGQHDAGEKRWVYSTVLRRMVRSESYKSKLNYEQKQIDKAKLKEKKT